MMMETEASRQQADRLADDLLNGAGEIAKELGVKKRRVYHLARTKQLPIGRLGRNLFASRNALRRAALKITAA